MSAAAPHRIPVDDGGLLLFPGAFAAEGERLFEALMREARWEQQVLRLFGRPVPAPRLSAWHAVAGQVYGYSGLRLEGAPLGPTLAGIRTSVEALTGQAFNSVLLNLYRDGRDSMSWHSDDERELGPAPFVASLSLGATRRLVLRSRAMPRQRLTLELEHGSLLLMEPPLQAHWQHAVPKTRRPCAARMNLTWRRIAG